MKIRFLEEISSNAHVALNTMQYDGWLIRFANGYTNRANSVSVIYPSTISLDVKVPYCEEVYEKADLPCVFNLTDEDKELNEYLKAHGYEVVTPTDVMIFSKVLVDTIYCSVMEDNKVVACASAAMEQGFMLLQNVVVSPEYRGHGYEKVYTYWYMRK